jgi:hypothetical protein
MQSGYVTSSITFSHMRNIGWDCGGEYRTNLVLVKRCEEIALFQGFLYPVFGLTCLWNYLHSRTFVLLNI